MCVWEWQRWWDRWVVGWGKAVVCMHSVRVWKCICVYVHMSTIGVVQPWWADVMLGSGPCLCSALAVVGAARKLVVI